MILKKILLALAAGVIAAVLGTVVTFYIQSAPWKKLASDIRQKADSGFARLAQMKDISRVQAFELRRLNAELDIELAEVQAELAAIRSDSRMKGLFAGVAVFVMDLIYALLSTRKKIPPQETRA